MILYTHAFVPASGLQRIEKPAGALKNRLVVPLYVSRMQPEGLEAQALTVNGKRAPKNGTLADVVEEDENVEMCIVIKGADEIEGIWIPFSQVEGYVPPTGMLLAATTKKRKAVKKEAGADSSDPNAPARRKIKRWDEAETNLLIELVTQHGKGKWKRVLLAGAATFDTHRTTVDLKDKWRNLERSGLAPDLPELPEDEQEGRAKKKKPKKEPGTANAAAAAALPPTDAPLQLDGSVEVPSLTAAPADTSGALPSLPPLASASPAALGPDAVVTMSITDTAIVPDTQPVDEGADGVPKLTDQPTPSKHPKEFKTRGARARGSK